MRWLKWRTQCMSACQHRLWCKGARQRLALAPQRECNLSDSEWISVPVFVVPSCVQRHGAELTACPRLTPLPGHIEPWEEHYTTCIQHVYNFNTTCQLFPTHWKTALTSSHIISHINVLSMYFMILHVCMIFFLSDFRTHAKCQREAGNLTIWWMNVNDMHSKCILMYSIHFYTHTYEHKNAPIDVHKSRSLSSTNGGSNS